MRKEADQGIKQCVCTRQTHTCKKALIFTLCFRFMQQIALYIGQSQNGHNFAKALLRSAMRCRSLEHAGRPLDTCVGLRLALAYLFDTRKRRSYQVHEVIVRNLCFAILLQVTCQDVINIVVAGNIARMSSSSLVELSRGIACPHSSIFFLKQTEIEGMIANA